MNSLRVLRRAGARSLLLRPRHRNLLTLAIETSCDDTSVAILETSSKLPAQLHFHEKVTADSGPHKGIHPLVALSSHQQNIALLVKKSLRSLPEADNSQNTIALSDDGKLSLRQKPDFISVTRGPGMLSALETGVDTAKGLSVAWDIPIIGVHHMQAHALTARLASALKGEGTSPQFPFLTLLVSGGHTMLLLSKSLCDHRILASTLDVSVGTLIDKAAREILPSLGQAHTYGPELERFAFPEGEDYNYEPPTTKLEMMTPRPTPYDWSLAPALALSGGGKRANLMAYSFVGLRSGVDRVLQGTAVKPKDPATVGEEERRVLAKETMRVAFEHLVSRVLLALEETDASTLVVSGGVASNRFLRHLMRKCLDARGYKDLEIVFPPVNLCTDNAAMIAWTGVEMWEAGYRSDLRFLPISKWALDPSADDGGILGPDCWVRRDEEVGV